MAGMLKSQDAVTESYKDIEAWVITTIHAFANAKGVRDLDELKSQAGEFIVMAIQGYDQSKGSLTNWIQFKLNKGFLSVQRNEAKRLRRLEEYRSLLKARSRNVCAAESRAWEGLDATLSDDAREIARYAIYPHPTVDSGIWERGGEFCPNKIKASIREYLTDKGWTRERIDSAFLELREYVR